MGEKELLKLIKQADLNDYKTIFELYCLLVESGYKATVEIENILKKTSKKQLREDDYFEFYKSYIERITSENPNWKENYFEKKVVDKSLQKKVEEEKNNPKYPALNFISWFLKLCAYLTLFIGIFFVAYSIEKGALYGKKEGYISEEMIPALVIPLFIAVIFFIIQLALSELIKVFIDIEFNTRNK